MSLTDCCWPTPGVVVTPGLHGTHCSSAGRQRHPAATWWFQLQGCFQTEPSSSASVLSTARNPHQCANALFIQLRGLKTCLTSVSKHLECRAFSCELWDWLGDDTAHLSLHPSLHFAPSLSWAVLCDESFSFLVGFSDRCSVIHPCRSGSECWVHLHGDTQRCFISASPSVSLRSTLFLYLCISGFMAFQKTQMEVDYSSAVNSLCILKVHIIPSWYRVTWAHIIWLSAEILGPVFSWK